MVGWETGCAPQYEAGYSPVTKKPPHITATAFARGSHAVQAVRQSSLGTVSSDACESDYCREKSVDYSLSRSPNQPQ